MYERFYGLQQRAFELTSDPGFVLLTPTYREALVNVEYGIAFRRGITLLLGEAGTGKTTILRRALTALTSHRGQKLVAVYMSNPTLTRGEFVEFLAHEFTLGVAACSSKTCFLRDLEAELLRRRAAGENIVLVIDEGQSLSLELLEELRLLGNIESDTESLLPIVLAGQPQLADRLNRPELFQLKQRVALMCALTPLTLCETAAYIAGCLRRAGGDAGAIFSRDAVLAVFRHSRGIPRVISVICDNALFNGIAVERRPIDKALIEEVCTDFDLLPARSSEPASGSRSAYDAPAGPKIRPFRSPAWMMPGRRDDRDRTAGISRHTAFRS